MWEDIRLDAGNHGVEFGFSLVTPTLDETRYDVGTVPNFPAWGQNVLLFPSLSRFGLFN
jgi:hypothetical protein